MPVCFSNRMCKWLTITLSLKLSRIFCSDELCKYASIRLVSSSKAFSAFTKYSGHESSAIHPEDFYS